MAGFVISKSQGIERGSAADGWVWPEQKSMLLCFDVKNIFFDVAMIEKTTDDQLG